MRPVEKLLRHGISTIKSRGLRWKMPSENKLCGPASNLIVAADEQKMAVIVEVSHAILSPFSTFLSGASKIVPLESATAPRIRTSEMNGPTCLGGKFTTAIT